MKVLMTGVDKERLGGMWTVANNYITSEKYNKNVELTYIPTSTNGNIIKRTLLMIKSFIKINSILSKKNTDLVHIHMAEKGSTFRARIIVKIAKKYNTKVLIHLHAGPFIDWYSSLNNTKQRKIKEMFDIVDCFLVLGEYWKESLKELVDENKIKVLYNGVNIPKVNNYSSNRKYITYMGVLKKEKGIYDLIDAIQKIDSKLDAAYKIKLCGIDLEGNIEKYISDRNLLSRIDLVGWVKGKEKDEIISNTVLNILPSYYEALSMTVIESMSYGIPIITTNISTMHEVLNNEELLITPGDVDSLADRIISLVKNKKKLNSISKTEYIRSKNIFDVNINIDKTLSIYKDL